MRVRVVLSVDIDPEAWMLAYGCAPEEVREDVRQYVLAQVQGSAAADEGGIRAVMIGGTA